MRYLDGSVDLVGDSVMGQPDDEGGWLDPDDFWEEQWAKRWYQEHYEGKTAEQVILGAP